MGAKNTKKGPCSNLSGEILRSPRAMLKYRELRYYINKGSTGELYGPFTWKPTKQKCAVKITLHISERIIFSAKDFDYIKEKRFLRLSHKNVLTILDAFVDTKICDSFTSYIVAEYAEGNSLYEVLHLKNNLNNYHPDLLKTPLDANVTRNWLLQIAKGVDYLHANDVVPEVLTSHCVLLMRSSNVLPNVLKINIFPEGKKHQAEGTCCAARPTFAWSSPEQCRDDAGLLFKAGNVWNYGVMVWEMQSKQHPQMGKKFGRVIIEIGDGNISRLNIDETWPDVFKQLIRSCLRFKKDDRPTFSSIIHILTKI